MKFGFVTCVRLGLSCMQSIYEIGGHLDLAITLRDDKAKGKSGRVYLDDFCSANDIPLLKIDHINDKVAVEAVQDLDWLFIVGWSQIAGPEVLHAPRKGVLGMHPSLLPVGRGRAAIPWAILFGLKETGVTLFKLDEGVDTGPIVDQHPIALGDRPTATWLYNEVDSAHEHLIKKCFTSLRNDSIQLQDQDDNKATVWPGRKPEDGEIDLNGSVYEADRLVRAVTKPYPGAFFYKNGKKTIVWSAQLDKPCDSQEPPLMLRFYDGVLYCISVEEVL